MQARPILLGREETSRSAQAPLAPRRLRSIVAREPIEELAKARGVGLALECCLTRKATIGQTLTTIATCTGASMLVLML